MELDSELARVFCLDSKNEGGKLTGEQKRNAISFALIPKTRAAN